MLLTTRVMASRRAGASFWAGLAVGLGLALGQASPASATVMVKLGLRDLVGRADRIFVGTVGASHSLRADNGYIVTDTLVSADSALAGPGGQVVVRRLGGTFGGEGLWVSGSPVLRQGDRVLLFTEGRAGARYVVGMRQGLFEVFADPQGTEMVRGNLEGVEFTTPAQGGSQALSADRGGAALPLESQPLARFVDQIRTTIRACAGEGNPCHP